MTDHETFRKVLTDLGFNVSIDRHDPEDTGEHVLVAENGEGDELFWSVIDSPEVWGVYFDLDRFTLDNATFRWGEFTTEGDKIVVDSVTGTRSATSGYGRRGFDGRLEVSESGSKVIETHVH